MSNDADLEYGPTPPGAQYEHTDIDPGIGYKFGIWLAVSMLIGAAIVYGTFALFRSQADAHDAMRAYPVASVETTVPPAPRLQTQPFKDVFELKTEQRHILNSYGWVDKANGLAHVPIDKAMEMTLQRGLPTRQGGSNEPSMVVQDSSAGRTSAPR
ncbi:MAG: hypothetical protein AB7O28_03850 [Vicinamibacterales bacterium]